MSCSGEESGGSEEICVNPDETQGVSNADGSAAVTTPGMNAPGDLGLGHSLGYNPQVAAVIPGATGNRWLPVEQPSLIHTSASGDIMATNGHTQLNFASKPDGTYKGMFGAQVKNTFSIVAGDGVYKQESKVGRGVRTVTYNDFDQPWERAGRIKTITDARGRQTEVTAYGPYGIVEMRKQSAAETFSLYYEYWTSGALTGNLRYVTLRRQVGATWSPIRRTTYLYYDGVEPHGALNDLKACKQQEWRGGSWGDVAVTYLRYYTAGETGGREHDLKYFVDPQSYAQLVQAGSDPLGSPAVDRVPEFATRHYEWNNAGTVVKNTIRGSGEATGTTGQTWVRTYNPAAPEDGFNVWKYKVTIDQADGNTRILYVNWLGLTLLEVVQQGSDPSRQWCTFYRYNEDARVVLQASPSGVIGYDESYPDLLGRREDGSYEYLRDNAGLIRITSYYAETTATSSAPGGVKGYFEYAALCQGQHGPEIKQNTTRYIASDDDDAAGTVFLPAAVDAYPADSDQEASKLTTQFAYLWYSGPARVQQKTTLWPVVPTDQNGTGEEESRKAYYDELGNLTWTMCELGMITRLEYDTALGLLLKKTADVGDEPDLPPGWSAQEWDHQYITTEYDYDEQGRLILTLGPEFDAVVDGVARTVRGAEWRVYKEAPAGDQTWTGKGFAAGETPDYTLVDPVGIVFSDKNGRATDVIASARTTGSGALTATDTFARKDWTRWTHADYNADALKIAERVYHAIPPSCTGLEGVNQDTGSPGTNYDQTAYTYDPNTNQLVRTVSPGGNIVEIVYDPIRRQAGTMQGTTDANLVQITAQEYDGGLSGGDSNVTRQTQFVDASTTRVTDFTYDFRGRRVTTDGEADYFQKLTYDNMNRVVMTEQFDTSESGPLVARNETLYDNRGRVYRTRVYGVNPATGDTDGVLTGNNHYDPVGHLMRVYAPGGGDSYTAYTYDTVGRRVRTLQCYGPPDVPGEVIEKQRLLLDKADHVLYTITSLRNTDATTMVDSYQAGWFDGAGRQIARASYGLLSSFTRPATVPARSDTVLVDTIEYDTAGRVFKTVDPRAIEARTDYDDASRVVRQIENYLAAPAPTDRSANRTTVTTYNADGKVQSVTLKMATLADDQTTIYTFGTTPADSDVASSLLLRSVQYGDSSGAGDRIEFQYNRQGQVKQRQDQNKTVHAYVFDGLGRTIRDVVTALGRGVDGRVRRIDTALDVRGQVSALTSMGDVAGTTVVNQVKLEYNEFRQLVRDYQSHSGAVNPATCLKVGYAYAGGTDVNYMRPNTLTYPNGRELVFRYGTDGSADDHLSRLQAIQDVADTSYDLVNFKYLGTAQVVRQDLQQPQVRFDLWGGTTGTYTGLDRFLRITRDLWQKYGGSPATLVSLAYGYDRDSNRVYRENDAARALGKIFFDQAYSYDGLNRLVDMQRGIYISGHLYAKKFEQKWGLDPAGNWSAFDQDNDGNGTWDLQQQRATNNANEIVDIAATAGATWLTPAFDPAGNMTVVPKPDLPTTGMECVYDAWNRLVIVKDAGEKIAGYSYDGRSYRTVKTLYADGAQTEARHYYYSSRWQVLEERLATPTPYDLQAQHVWGIGINQLILRDRATDGSATLNERLYALQDAHFNVVCLVSTGGTAVERCEYEAYGKVSYYDGAYNPIAASAFDWTVLYSGYLLDDETKLYYVRFRYYHDALGLWITRDPITDITFRRHGRITGLIASTVNLNSEFLNSFLFCRNRPIIALDLLGLWTVSNNGTCPVIAKPEKGGFGNPATPPIVVMPGETIDDAIDGVISCCPTKPDCVYMKVIDGGRVEVGSDGTMKPVAPGEEGEAGGGIPGDIPPSAGWYCWQAIRGGCKGHGFTDDGAWGNEKIIKKWCDEARKSLDDEQITTINSPSIETIPRSVTLLFPFATSLAWGEQS